MRHCQTDNSCWSEPLERRRGGRFPCGTTSQGGQWVGQCVERKLMQAMAIKRWCWSRWGSSSAIYCRAYNGLLGCVGEQLQPLQIFFRLHTERCVCTRCIIVLIFLLEHMQRQCEVASWLLWRPLHRIRLDLLVRDCRFGEKGWTM